MQPSRRYPNTANALIPTSPAPLRTLGLLMERNTALVWLPERGLTIPETEWRSAGSITGEHLVGGGDLFGIGVGDSRREDPIPERPRHDLGSLFEASELPGNTGRVPGRKAALSKERGACLRPGVLVEPYVAHLVEQNPT